jgi:predicted transcriptional regulator of viral defense system
LPASGARLAGVFRAAKEVVSVDLAAKTLGIERGPAAKILSRWRAQGWLRRVGPGLYVPVPLDLAGSEQLIAAPWVLVPILFGQCYIGGWTAAHLSMPRQGTEFTSARKVSAKINVFDCLHNGL